MNKSGPELQTATNAVSIGDGGSETHVSSTENDLLPAFGPPAQAGEVGSLGPYRVVKELGRGGMGAVYLAIDPRLNRKLALKVMLPLFAANPASRERFLREARAAAQVAHDNVVTVFEADERDGVPYIAMQFLQGYPLDEYLKKHGTPTIPQILRIAEETAAGLAAAHACGLIHRDIKPANLWLEAPNGRVKVLDFGLAKPVDAEAEITKSGDVVGTPAYMSPEQARGERVDHRTDLFSLGAVLYRLCTGTMPFQGPSTMAVLMALGMKEPPPVREVSPEVPEPLAALIHQLLAKNPEQRPPNADDVVRRVHAITAGAAPQAAPGGAAPSQGQPQVIYVPIHITAQPEDNAFADLSATEVESAPVLPGAVTRPQRKESGGRGMWVAAGLAALVAACVVAGVIIIIKNKDGSETKIEVPDDATVTIKGKDGKTVAQVGPVGKQPAADVDRKAAEWVFSIGGTVSVNGETKFRKAAVELPKERFTLTSVSLYGPSVSDAALEQLKGLKGLTYLSLRDTKVSDAGMEHLKDFQALTWLGLNGTKVTNAGLAHLKEIKSLTYLTLAGTMVLDAGMEHLKELKGLTELDVRITKVTPKGVEQLHAAVPGCKILHDGGTIEAAPDPDRKAAEYVLSVGGSVKVNGMEVKAPADLPKDRLTLTWAIFLSSKSPMDAGLAQFKDCKSLTRLDLGGTLVTNAGLAHFKDCKNLIYLNLASTAITDVGLAHFKGCTKLISLDLYDTPVTNTGLAYFKNCKELTQLGLSNTGVTDEGLVYFKDCKNLTHLRLITTPVTDAGIAHFKDCKELTYLDVRKTKVTAKGLADFHAAVPGCKIEHDGGTIEAIDVDRKAAEYTLAVGGAVKVNGGESEIKAVAGLPKERFTLTAAAFDYLDSVTDAGLAAFKDCKNLTLLSLNDTKVSDAGLANFKGCKNLTELYLGNTQVSDAGLANFKDCKNLTELHLSATQVGDEGLAHFKDCKNLTNLVLSRSQVSDAGLVHLKDCKNLTHIWLDNTRVTDAGLAHFKDCKNLTLFWLSDTQVSDVGLKELADKTKLTWLKLQKTKVTEAGVKQLAAALPGCKIDHDGGTIEPKK
ncbi:MAG: protein kinase [Planctomycetes bacterium]|nr:protein kinase [Planctomycetota bacterium]